MAFVILDMGYSEDTLQTTSAEEQKIREELLQEEEATQVEMEAQEERTGRSATSGTEYFT